MPVALLDTCVTKLLHDRDKGKGGAEVRRAGPTRASINGGSWITSASAAQPGRTCESRSLVVEADEFRSACFSSAGGAGYRGASTCAATARVQRPAGRAAGGIPRQVDVETGPASPLGVGPLAAGICAALRSRRPSRATPRGAAKGILPHAGFRRHALTSSPQRESFARRGCGRHLHVGSVTHSPFTRPHFPALPRIG